MKQAAAQEFTGTITGTAVDAQGNTLAGAWVVVGCGNRPLGGRIPGARSDEHGRFAVGSLELTDCRVFACDETAGVPCLAPVNPALAVQVKLSAAVPLADIQVQLGEKGTVIRVTVRDAHSGEKLNAIVEYYPLKFPKRKSSMSAGGDFQVFIAPATDYALTISSSGYKPWSYASHHPGHGALRLKPRALLDLAVQLQPLR